MKKNLVVFGLVFGILAVSVVSAFWPFSVTGNVAKVWDYNWCSASAGRLCPAGEGDCDTDKDCSGGSKCIQNNGDKFGQLKTMDVCACPDGSSWNGKECVKPNKESSTSCTDSDGGDNLYVKGKTVDVSTSKVDNCIDTKTVYEYYCSFDKVAQTTKVDGSTYLCPSGYSCSDGACITASSSGKDYYTKAEVDAIIAQFEDALAKRLNTFVRLPVRLTDKDSDIGVYIMGEYYRVNLVSASDTSATIKVTDSSGGKSETKEVNEGASKKINGITVAVTNTDETNLALTADLKVYIG